MTFGWTVKTQRRSQGLTLREFAKKVLLSPSYLSLMERDIQPPPSEDAIVRIAKVLRINTDYMLALAGKISTKRKLAIIDEILKAPPV
jgi:transcriptional regulator with XRE-family HTH domain